MKKLFLQLLFVPLVSLGQTFNDYKYIKLVSNDYGVDITSTASEIFNQKGFIVLGFDSSLPKDAKEEPCNILTAKIYYRRGKTGYTNSILELSLLDCGKKVIYKRKSKNTTNFNQPDVLNNFIKCTNAILPRKSIGTKSIGKSGEWAGNGSGVIISKSGYIITNHHVIDDADDIEVEFILNDEVQKFNAEVVQVDKTNDLAIVKIVDVNFDGVGELPYNFKTRSSDVGTKVFAFGYPMALSIMGKEIKVTDGMISSKTGFDGDITTYQITAPIQAGNSGGPLFDEKGNLIGINSSGLRLDVADNVAYSIKTNYILNLIDILPKSIELPSNTKLETLPLTEQIKEISKYVVLIKVK
jgi:S1-C subfamily serine protease